MEFKIGTVSKMTGLSTSGIRFLEEKGFIRPTRERKGTYRSYGIEDVVAILNYRNNRSCGLSEEELLAFGDGVTVEECCGVLEKHSEEIETDILEKTRLLRHVRERARDTALIAQKDSFCQKTERAALIWIPITPGPGASFRWPEDVGLEIPYLDSVLRLGTGDGSSLEIGIGLFEYEVRHCGFLTQSDVQYFPKHTAYHMIVEIGPDMLPVEADRARIDEVLAKIAQEGGKPGGVFSKRVLSTVREGRAVRYDNLWIDVD